jgi:hypothetical protein
MNPLTALAHRPRLRHLPYPDGKTFAFTIIDDTDQAKLASTREVYEFLHSLGLRTTKTVWVTQPHGPLGRPQDAGDTLANDEYAQYMVDLQRRGFEIALHNVSSQESRRQSIHDGLERFREVVGCYPKINVHHEKNAENLYFDFAQRGYRPELFRTRALRRLHHSLQPKGLPAKCGSGQCHGEDPGSEYFWGDLCRERISYVRTNVFYRDINTLGCNPNLPYVADSTPFVNAWFDSSNGQDAATFNAILCDHQIRRLRQSEGCSILYTHFGKGFVTENGGQLKLNADTKSRLRAVAGDSNGWYAPVGEVLDRLRAFQRVRAVSIRGGLLLINENPFEVRLVTLKGPAGSSYRDAATGELISGDGRGCFVLPALAPRSTTAVLGTRAEGRRWYDEVGQPWILDCKTAARKLCERFLRYA